MMGARREVDDSLVRRVSLLSRGEQRWLKLAIQAIQTNDSGAWSDTAPEEPTTPEPRRLKAANLEDVITGKANLKDQLEAYPELAGELEGLSEVIDLLRESGERRRRKGEDILRE